MWLLDWRASPEVRMPHGKKKLSICDRDAIRAWIREGAKNNDRTLADRQTADTNCKEPFRKHPCATADC